MWPDSPLRFEPADNFRIVAYSEVILGRDLLAGEFEICWEIPATLLKHRIAGRPSPEKSSPKKVALGAYEGEFPLSLKRIY